MARFKLFHELNVNTLLNNISIYQALYKCNLIFHVGENKIIAMHVLTSPNSVNRYRGHHAAAITASMLLSSIVSI